MGGCLCIFFTFGWWRHPMGVE